MGNHTCLCLPSRGWSSFTDPGGMEVLVGMSGWLHTEINVRHRELNPDTVSHLSTAALRRLTLLIETNALPLSQTTTTSGELASCGSNSFKLIVGKTIGETFEKISLTPGSITSLCCVRRLYDLRYLG